MWMRIVFLIYNINMANIELIKKLREMTNAGISDVVKALNESGEDLDKAVQWLRERGIAKAAKKAGAIAAEGIANVVIKGNTAVIFEVNCETDFVAANDNFENLCSDIGLTLLEGGTTDIEVAKQLRLSNDKTIDEACKELTGKIGEKIELRRFEVVGKDESQMFSYYQHFNKRIAVLLLLNKQVDANIAKDIAMHAAAMNPKYLNEASVDPEWLQNEIKIIKEQMSTDPKFANMANDPKMAPRIDGIVKGKVNKLLAEVTLEAQPFVKDSAKTVKQHINSAGADVIFFVRYQVGEGIEKKVVDFAAEVASQMK